MRATLCLAVLLATAAPPGAVAEVVDSAANGFTVKLSLNIQGAPDGVYRQLLRPADWWNPEHTFSGDAHNLSIEPKPMGCFCEKLPGGGGVRHLEVIFLQPGKTLRMLGALGPLQGLAATGTMTITLSPAAGGTKLEMVYAVSGYLAKGMNTWAAPADAMLSEQLTRLKNAIEHAGPPPKTSP